MDKDIENLYKSFEESKFSVQELEYRVKTLEGGYSKLENDLLSTRTLVMDRLDQVNNKLDQLKTENAIAKAVDMKDKAFSAGMNMLVNTLIQAVVLFGTLKMAGVI